MSANEIIALIRDIFIIVASGVVIVVLLGVGYVLRRLYPSIRRTTQYVEQSSSILQNIVSQPVNLIGAVVELFNRGLGMLETFKKRERRKEDGED
jgi:alanyl-tRNA synthetase